MAGLRMETFLLGTFLLLCLVPQLCLATLLHSRPDIAASSIRLEPTYEEIPAAGGRGATYALWQAPASPHAILFIAHGSSRGPEVWWDASPGCPFCAGLPEEKAIIQSALASGHAVITIRSVNTDGWNLQSTSPDLMVVRQFLGSWRHRQGFPDNLPVAGLGISMGGIFLSILALQMKFYAVVLQISPGEKSSFEAATATFPPVLFISMSKDVEWGQTVQDNIAILSSKGLRGEIIECQPLPVYESFFSERIPGLEVEVSAALFQALLQQGYLDDEGYLNQPAFMSWEVNIDWSWASFLRSLHVLSDGSAWTDPVVEELTVSYGFHAVTSSKVSQMLEWLHGAKHEQL